MRLCDVDGYTTISKSTINNIPATRIFSAEQSMKYNIYIQKLIKEVLIASATRTDGFRYDEVGIIARLDGSYKSRPIYGYWNDVEKISSIKVNYNVEYDVLTNESDDQSLVFVHNHPDNTGISRHDASVLLEEAALKCVVAVGNSGGVHYIAKTSDEFNKIRVKIVKASMADVEARFRIYDKIASNPEKYFIEIK